MATGPWKSIDADRPLVIMPATPYTRTAAAPYVASPAGRPRRPLRRAAANTARPAAGDGTATSRTRSTWPPVPTTSVRESSDVTTQISPTVMPASPVHSCEVRRSPRTVRGSCSRNTLPEANTGGATVSGTRGRATSWHARPVRIRAKPASQRGVVTSVRTRFNGSRAFSGGSALSAPFSRTKPALKASVVTSASTTPRITAARPGSRAPCLDQQDAGGGRPETEQAIQRPQHERDVLVRRASHALAGEAARGEEPGQRPLGEHVQVARL